MISAILLAAGESTRMGQLKALLSWHGVPLLRYQIEQLEECGRVEQIVVVLGHASERLLPIVEATSARAVLNPRYREGRATSIATGVAALDPTVEAILVTSVDQPRSADVLRRLIAEHLRSGRLVSRPIVGEEHGHPTVFAGALLSELLRVDEASEGMKSLLRRHAEDVADVPFEDRSVLLNLNTPEEYERALVRAEGSPLS